MLEQVREAGFALGFVRRADAVPHADEHRGDGVVGMHDHRETVVEAERLVLDLELARDVVGRARLRRDQPGGQDAQQGQGKKMSQNCSHACCSSIFLCQF